MTTLYFAGLAVVGVAIAGYTVWRLFLSGRRVGEIVCWRDSVTYTPRSVRMVVIREDDARVQLQARVTLAVSATMLSATQALDFAALLEEAARVEALPP